MDLDHGKPVLRMCVAWRIFLDIACLIKAVCWGFAHHTFSEKAENTRQPPPLWRSWLAMTWKSFKSPLLLSEAGPPWVCSPSRVAEPTSSRSLPSYILVPSHIAGPVVILSPFLLRSLTHSAVAKLQQHLTAIAALSRVVHGATLASQAIFSSCWMLRCHHLISAEVIFVVLSQGLETDIHSS